MLKQQHLIGEAFWLMGPQPGNECRIGFTHQQIIECRIVKNIVVIIATQERQKVQAGFCFRGAKDAKMGVADMGSIEVIGGMTGTSVVDRYIGG